MTDIIRGDIYRIDPVPGTYGVSRLALVLQVHDDYVEVALIHPYHEFATSTDAVVPSDLTGTPYDIVIQTDLRGTVWTSQVSHRVGGITESLIETINDAIEKRIPFLPSKIMIGIPLHGPMDARWGFKAQEGRELTKLVVGCTTTLLGWD